ncbi:DUF4241 domain-containing protein [Propioniciclava coleopterorum]|uniref:DUF4241 domain-containing protein n=1 Tax=Propioniciclava coleopterorum TaxID=2714937 RepID=A0A6G7Y8R7_9ACTN|nr:DUF4241 domain-containing protein [Propioniciclava coleopterorum]QIK73212.1 DUF4241 domain-containing protein [Propioniciclava coleopterorum]
METPDLLALATGTVPGWKYHHRVVDLGVLQLPTGVLEASDPFTSLGSGVRVQLPPGAYPVKVTIADVSDEPDGGEDVNSYLSVVIADGEVARVRPLMRDDVAAGVEPTGGKDAWVGVDAGTVAFVDVGALMNGMPAGVDWYETYFESDDPGEQDWFTRLDDGEGSALIVLPLATAGENIALASSGYGDGGYSLLASYDTDGRLLGVHLDLEVEERREPDASDDEDDPDDQPTDHSAHESGPSGEGRGETDDRPWWKRIFG